MTENKNDASRALLQAMKQVDTTKSHVKETFTRMLLEETAVRIVIYLALQPPKKKVCDDELTMMH